MRNTCYRSCSQSLWGWDAACDVKPLELLYGIQIVLIMKNTSCTKETITEKVEQDGEMLVIRSKGGKWRLGYFMFLHTVNSVDSGFCVSEFCKNQEIVIVVFKFSAEIQERFWLFDVPPVSC
ncbi:retinol dehydrogenase 12 [Moniliophthora roreri]|nr:retinol dehydrogenase 12 [Moniliophthora roreri]